MIRNANICAHADYVASKCASRRDGKERDYCAAAAKVREECKKGKLVHFGCATNPRGVEARRRRRDHERI